MRKESRFSPAETKAARPAMARPFARSAAWGLGLAAAMVGGAAIGAWPVAGPLGALRGLASAVAREPWRECQVFLILAAGGVLAAWAWGEVVGEREGRPSLWKRAVIVPAIAAAVGFLVTFAPAFIVAYRLRAAEAAASNFEPRWRPIQGRARSGLIPEAEDAARAVAEADERLGPSWPQGAGGARPADSNFERAVMFVSPTGALAEDPARPFWDEGKSGLPPQIARPLRAGIGEAGQALAIAMRLADMDREREAALLPEDPLQTLTPGVQRARRVALLLAVDAALAADADDIDRALHSARAMLGAARSIGDEPSLVSQSLRAAIARDAAAVVRRALNQGEASDSALAAIQSALLAERDHPAARIAIRGERAMGVELLRLAGAGRLDPDDLGIRNWPPPAMRGRMALLSPLWSLWCAKERADLIEGGNELLAVLIHPEAEWLGAASTPPGEEGSPGADAWPMPPPVAAPILARLRSFLPSQLLLRAELGAMAVLVAAERHRRATGEWPITVDEIRAEILPMRPVDPFSDRPYLVDYTDGSIGVSWAGPELGADLIGPESTWGGPLVGPRLRDVARRGVLDPSEEESGSPRFAP